MKKNNHISFYLFKGFFSLSLINENAIIPVSLFTPASSDCIVRANFNIKFERFITFPISYNVHKIQIYVVEIAFKSLN